MWSVLKTLMGYLLPQKHHHTVVLKEPTIVNGVLSDYSINSLLAQISAGGWALSGDIQQISDPGYYQVCERHGEGNCVWCPELVTKSYPRTRYIASVRKEIPSEVVKEKISNEKFGGLMALAFTLLLAAIVVAVLCL
jgi:hypothetical protein